MLLYIVSLVVVYNIVFVSVLDTNSCVTECTFQANAFIKCNLINLFTYLLEKKTN